MDTQLKSAFILIDNLEDNSQLNYSRQTLAEKLERKDLSYSASSITRLLNFIEDEFGISVKHNSLTSHYEIVEEESNPNYKEKYQRYRSLSYQMLLQKNALENNLYNRYLSFGFATENKNIDLVQPLLDAIFQNKKLELTYHPFYEDKPKKWIVCPVFIKEYLNRWYLITEKIEDRHNVFAIDRIVGFELLNIKFERSNEESFELYTNTIGVDFSGSLKKVKLWVSKDQYPYFKTLPFHPSQKMEEETKDGFIISFTVTLNYELKQRILFYGSTIKVLEPNEFKKDIVEELRRSLEGYGK